MHSPTMQPQTDVVKRATHEALDRLKAISDLGGLEEWLGISRTNRVLQNKERGQTRRQQARRVFTR